MRTLILAVSLLFSFATPLTAARAADGGTEGAATAEWTWLVFINGNNNLDEYGAKDINEMERVGSTDQLNVVVQWASLESPQTRRLRVEKDDNPSVVTSPVIESLGRVDMGNYKNLVEFVRWGVQRYPAKRYFVTVWNHGNGWQKRGAGNGPFQPEDISYDDLTGNKITTEQLGIAMNQIASIIGRKVDIYGSDACLMSMAEVADEMATSVQYFVGSQNLEPGDGWPYDTVLARWAQSPQASALDVSRILTEEYVRSYQGGTQGTVEITFSAMNLEKIGAFKTAVRGFGDAIRKLKGNDLQQALSAAEMTLNFDYMDYLDVIDFSDRMAEAGVQIDRNVTAGLKAAVAQLVEVNLGSGEFARAHGVSVWIPLYADALQEHIKRYEGLKFHKATGWGSTLRALHR